MAQTLHSSKNQLPLDPTPITVPNQTVNVKTLKNISSTHPTIMIPSEFSDIKSSSTKSTVTSIKELLDSVEGYSIGYELDCRGWCEMPAVFKASITQVTDNDVPLGHQIFTCHTFLPYFCDSAYDCNIDFLPVNDKTNKSYNSLKLKSGVYSESWCASNDKIDVFDLSNETKEKLGFIVRKSGICGYSWIIKDDKGKQLYTITNTSCVAKFCCGCPCGKCSGIKLVIKPFEKATSCGIIEKEWICCCADKINLKNCNVEFPADATWVDKALIVSACIWIYKEIGRAHV